MAMNTSILDDDKILEGEFGASYPIFVMAHNFRMTSNVSLNDPELEYDDSWFTCDKRYDDSWFTCDKSEVHLASDAGAVLITQAKLRSLGLDHDADLIREFVRQAIVVDDYRRNIDLTIKKSTQEVQAERAAIRKAVAQLKERHEEQLSLLRDKALIAVGVSIVTITVAIAISRFAGGLSATLICLLATKFLLRKS